MTQLNLTERKLTKFMLFLGFSLDSAAKVRRFLNSVSQWREKRRHKRWGIESSCTQIDSDKVKVTYFTNSPVEGNDNTR